MLQVIYLKIVIKRLTKFRSFFLYDLFKYKESDYKCNDETNTVWNQYLKAVQYSSYNPICVHLFVCQMYDVCQTSKAIERVVYILCKIRYQNNHDNRP